MASKVQVCNLALTRIAGARITTLEDGTTEAKDCNAIYDLIAEEVMASGSWPSVRRRASLAQLSITPAFEYSYAYQLPLDPKCLRVISVNESKAGEIDFIIEGSHLLVNESEVSIRYLAFVEDVNSYDIYLRQAIVDRLAAELIYKKTGQLSAYKASLDYAAQHAKELLSMASVAGSGENINSDTFIDVRNGGWPNEGRLRD